MRTLQRMICLCLAVALTGCLWVKAEISVSARCAVVMDAATGTVLWEKNAHETRSMASTTKIMTTLLALEQSDLQQEIQVTAPMVAVEGTSMGLQAGDTVTLKDLCYGMMLSSGNDAANVTAFALAGDLPSFSKKMNEKAAALQMKNSCFITPSGLDAQGHQSTAYDMALLTRAALENPLFCQIAACSTASVYFGNPPQRRTLSNHNRLLKEYEGCVGVKTGFTKKAGRCLVSAAKRKGATLICVTLGAPDDWNDHKTLLDFGFDQMEQVTFDGQTLPLPIAGGTASSVAVTHQAMAVTIPKSQLEHLSFQLQIPHFLYAPVEKESHIGQATVVFKGSPLCSTPVSVMTQVPICPKKPTFWERLWEWIRKLLGL